MRILLQHVGEFLRGTHAVRSQARLVGGKQYVAQRDDDAALGFACGQFGELGFEDRRLRQRSLRLVLGYLRRAFGLVGFVGALLEANQIALLGGVVDFGLGCLTFDHFLGQGDLLFGEISELVDVLGAVVIGRRQIRLTHRVGSLFHFERRVAGGFRIALYALVVAARLIEQTGGGWRRTAGAEECGDEQQCRGEMCFFHDRVLVICAAAVKTTPLA